MDVLRFSLRSSGGVRKDRGCGKGLKHLRRESLDDPFPHEGQTICRRDGRGRGRRDKHLRGNSVRAPERCHSPQLGNTPLHHEIITQLFLPSSLGRKDVSSCFLFALLLIFAVAPLWGCERGSRVGGPGTHSRQERWCLPERCVAPQDGRTPLHNAASGGHAAAVEKLWEAGADLEAKDKVWRRGGWDLD